MRGRPHDTLDRRRGAARAILALAALALAPSACDGGGPAPDPAAGQETPRDVATPVAREQDPVVDDGDPFAIPIERPKPGDARAAEKLVMDALGFERAQRPTEAGRALVRALELDPANVAALVERGFRLLDPGPDYNAGEALLRLRTARLIEPGQIHAICGEGIARAALVDADRAEPLLRRAIAELPPQAVRRRALACAALGDVLASTGRAEESLAFYARAAPPELEPRLAAIALAKEADVLSQLDRDAEADPKLRRAIELDPANLRAHYLRSVLLARRGEAAESKREARIHEILRQLFDHDTPRFLEDVEWRTGLWRALEEEFPEWPRARFQLVRELLDRALWHQALSEVADLARKGGPTAELHYLAARAKAGQGDLPGAWTEVEAMRRLDRNVPPQVLVGVLEDWRRGHPEVDPATFERTLREWMQRQ